MFATVSNCNNYMKQTYNRNTSLGMLSGKIHSLLKLELQKQLEKRGILLKVDYFPVVNKLMEEDRVTQQIIAGWIGFDRPRTSRMIDELEKAGIVIREDDPTSRRNKLVCLTKNIAENKNLIIDSLLETMDIAFTGFNKAERNKMIEQLQSIKINLEKK